MKKIIVMLAMVFMVSACGLIGGERSIADRYSAMEASYNATLRVLITAREFCVEDHKNFNVNLCVLGDEEYVVVDKVQKKAKWALDNAKGYIEANNEEEAETWIGHFKTAFSDLRGFVIKVQGVF